MGLTWTQPVCDEDYQRLCPGREPHRIVGDYREAETCCLCGHPTRSGIYVRIDPRTVPYPREKD